MPRFIVREFELEPRLVPANTAPELIREINPLPKSSFPTAMTEIGGTLYFQANTESQGIELWRSDGTSLGTMLVRDLNGGPGSSRPSQFTGVGGVTYFTANTSTGYELWRTNGTSAGTVIVRDIQSGSIGSEPRDLTNVGGVLYFAADDGTSGFELWRSDGTSTGTTLVRDILAGTGSSSPLYLTNVNGVFFFSANDGSTGRELWRSNGTSTGTMLVRNIRSGAAGSNPEDLIEMGGLLYFTADDGTNGRELWRSDGTSSGTVLVRDIRPGGSSNLRYPVVSGGELYFSTNDGDAGYELWRSDGTSSGTLLVREIQPGAGGSFPNMLTPYDGRIYFSANDGAGGFELWRSDGTSSGTILVRDIRPGPSSSAPLHFRNLGATLLFTANDGAAGEELWRSDGTSSGTVLVRDIRPGPIGQTFTGTYAPDRYFALLGGALYFEANDGATGVELWRSDGTSSGTAIVRDTLGFYGSYPSTIIDAAGVLYFSANDGATGVELFRSDGTSSGTANVADLAFSSSDSTPTELTDINGVVLFRAGGPGAVTDDFELWRSDGTSSGTLRVRDIRPGPYSSALSDFTRVGNLLLFVANNGASGRELWKSDGTSSGSTPVHDIRPGSVGSYPRDLIEIGGLLYFTANDGANGFELWRSDGTSSGTVLVRDVRPGAVGMDSAPGLIGATLFFTNVIGTLYFRAFDGVNGIELWRSDGTSGGTTLVHNISAGSGSSNPFDLAAIGGHLYFSATDGSSGRKFWRSDGTSSGTVLIHDIQPGPFFQAGGLAYFKASDTANGYELWRTDGTSSGTLLVRDIAPGAAASNPSLFTNVAGALYFAANDGANGFELWRSDGTSGGTTMIDIEPGFAAAPNNLFARGDRLYFAANRSDLGVELFTLREDSTPPIVASITSPSANGTYGTGQAITVSIQFSEPVELAGGDLTLTLDSGGSVAIAPFSGMSASGVYTVLAGQSSPDLTVTAIALAGAATLRDAAGNDANLALPVGSNLADNAALIVNPGAPTTVNYIVNVSTVQRSRLTRIDLMFSNPVNAATLNTFGAITLTRTTPGDGVQVDVSNGLLIAPASGMVAAMTLTFANTSTSGIQFASLADGRWRLAIPALSYQSALNDPNLRRLFGDSNNDGTIDGSDLADFGVAFGSTGASAFDFNNDLTVDALDFGEFGNRFGLTL